MKKIFFLLLIVITMNSMNAQTYETLKDKNGHKMLRGFITDSLLKTDTAFAWYSDAQEAYFPKENIVNIYKQHRDSVFFLIFMGTWCGDSQFIIPRFIKILDSAGCGKDKITIVAVDRKKKDITSLAEIFHITNVPTIIPFKNGKELGRIIEYGDTGKYEEEIAALIQNIK
jgi:thiol-disulfide isomerase/thioredoxin